MPEYPIRDSILTSLNAQEPWPENVKLFQPYEVEQILLPDNASCLAVQAFLKMCNLPFEVEMRWNAEFMSPSGRVPFIKCGAFVVSELEPIAQFAANKGVSLCIRLSTEEKAEMRAYMSLITNVLVNAELYISWIDNDTFNQVTKVRNSSVYPWPLGWLQTRAKRNNVAKRLKALHWHDKTLDQVLADVEQCCNSLSQRLGDKDYFFGTPTPLDALVYGHIRALLSAQGPKAALMLKSITTALLHLVMRVASLTGMKLTSQEEFLLHEAFTPRRYRSPATSDRTPRTRLSRLSVRRMSGDNINKDAFAKPFASKNLMIMTAKDGSLTCKYNEHGRFGTGLFRSEDEYSTIMEIIEDIFDKVEETVIDGLNTKMNADSNDFEVIAFPNQGVDVKNISPLEGLEMLEDITENSLSIDDITYTGLEDTVEVLHENVNDEMVTKPEEVIDTEVVMDIEAVPDTKPVIGPEMFVTEMFVTESDGMDSEIESPPIIYNEQNEKFHTPELTDSSNDHCPREEYGSTIESGVIGDCNKELTINKSNTSLNSSPFYTESKSTLKMLSDEISVESLLDYLRKRNAAYLISNMPEVADVD